MKDILLFISATGERMKDILLFISAIFVGAFIGIAIGFLLIGLINDWDTLK